MWLDSVYMNMRQSRLSLDKSSFYLREGGPQILRSLTSGQVSGLTADSVTRVWLSCAKCLASRAYLAVRTTRSQTSRQPQASQCVSSVGQGGAREVWLGRGAHDQNSCGNVPVANSRTPMPLSMSYPESRTIQCAEGYSTDSSTSAESSSFVVHCAESRSLFQVCVWTKLVCSMCGWQFDGWNSGW